VGYYRAYGENPLSLILHWNGQAWTQVTAPDAHTDTDDLLYGVSAASPGDMWAVGQGLSGDGAVGLVFHWSGTAWQQ
jgi:hypothetical protein